MKHRKPSFLLPVLLALPLLLCAAAAVIWVIPEAREWLLAAAKVVVTFMVLFALAGVFGVAGFFAAAVVLLVFLAAVVVPVFLAAVVLVFFAVVVVPVFFAAVVPVFLAAVVEEVFFAVVVVVFFAAVVVVFFAAETFFGAFRRDVWVTPRALATAFSCVWVKSASPASTRFSSAAETPVTFRARVSWVIPAFSLASLMTVPTFLAGMMIPPFFSDEFRKILFLIRKIPCAFCGLRL